MRRSSRQFNRLISSDKPEVPTDDGGSGLLEACKERFAPPEWTVECDSRHTVWVKRADGTKSFGTEDPATCNRCHIETGAKP